MLQIKGGHLNHWNDSNTMATAVIVIVAVITIVVAIVVIITVAITVAITIVTGCCHCFQDNKSLMIFDISHAFLHTETGGCVVSHLEMYRTNVLMYRTMVLLVRSTKVRC
jgi:hypothetical protein